MPEPDFDMPVFLEKNLNFQDIKPQETVFGRIVVSFVVNEDGSLSNVRISRGANPYIDNIVINVFKNMPKWKPGKLNCKVVKVEVHFPIGCIKFD